MSLQFEERVRGAVTAYGKRRERAVAAIEHSNRMQKQAVAKFNEIVDSIILPIFHSAAELLRESCAVQIHRHEYTEERPFILSVDLVISEKPDAQIRHPKLEICLKKRNLRLAIFTENLRDAKLQVEEMELSELTAAKLEQCTSSFIAEIFR